MEFVYLKWLLNNFNYIEKLQLHLKSDKLTVTRYENIWKSLVDANFIRQYCLPDTICNLIDFNFYICSGCQLSYKDIDKITNSFKIHSFFIDHQWTNVKCLFDPIISCQHLFSSFTNTLQHSNNKMWDTYLNENYEKFPIELFSFVCRLVIIHIFSIGHILTIPTLASLTTIHHFICFSNNSVNYLQIFLVSKCTKVNYIVIFNDTLTEQRIR